jgi:hypothetical protein
MKTIKYALEDYRTATCQFCGKEANPHIRHCVEVLEKGRGIISSSEIEACIPCSNKKFKGWRRRLE